MKRPPPPDEKKLQAEEAKLYPPEVCEQLKQRRQQRQQIKDPKTPVLLVNKDAYLLWCQVAGIWAMGAMGGLLGIAWERAEAVLRLQQYPITPDAIRGCRVIESACINEYHKD